MEFKQLQSFVAVVKCEGFTKAAEQLYTSQPTISAHIRQLEEELNSRLIVRTTKSIEITPRGLELYEYASHVLTLRDDFLKRWNIENQNTLRIGASTIPSNYFLPELLPACRTIYHDIQFHIHQGDSHEIIDGLLSGNFEVGLVGANPATNGITFIPFYEDSMVIVTPVTPKFLRLKKEGVDSKELLIREPLLLRETSVDGKKFMERYLQQLNLVESELNIIAKLNVQESIKQLVASGLGISILSQKVVADYAAERKVLTFPLSNITDNRKYYIAFRTDFIQKKHTAEFISFIIDYYKSSMLKQHQYK